MPEEEEAFPARKPTARYYWALCEVLVGLARSPLVELGGYLLAGA